MEVSLIDYFRAFHAVSKEYDLSASARSIYFALLGEFNAAHWVDELCISDRYMLELSGVKSVATVHDARNLLKSLKFIDFRKGKNRKSIYRLLQDRITTTPAMQLSERQPNSRQTPGEQSGLVPYTARPKDVKTVDKDLFNDNAIAGARTGAGTGKPERAKTAESGEQLANTDRADSARLAAGLMDASTVAGALPLKSPGNENEEEIDRLLDFWEEAGGAKLNQLLVAKLNLLLKQYGFEKVKAAIEEANGSNNDSRHGFSFNYVLYKLQEDKKEKKKEGERFERTSGTSNRDSDKPRYSEPKYSGREEWQSFDESAFDE